MFPLQQRLSSDSPLSVVLHSISVLSEQQLLEVILPNPIPKLALEINRISTMIFVIFTYLKISLFFQQLAGFFDILGQNYDQLTIYFSFYVLGIIRD